MKKFKYAVDVDKIGLSDEAKADIVQAVVFENNLTAGLKIKYPKGLTADRRSIHRRILAKLDAAKDDYILLEAAEFETINSIFGENGVEFDPHATRVVGMYQDNLAAAEEIKDEA